MLEVTIVQGIFYHQDLCDRHLEKEKVKRTSKWVAGNEWGLELPDKIPKSSLSFVHIPARGCSYHFHVQTSRVLKVLSPSYRFLRLETLYIQSISE